MAAVGQYLRYSTVFDESANLRVLALAAVLGASRPAGVREIYPGYGSVYVEWDDATLANDRAAAWIDAALATPAADAETTREVRVPVRYGGLDTAEVAAATGLDADAIAEIHAAATYRVCARATAGQPLMGGTDPRLAVPRRPTPRVDVPALSVAIAGPQATIYSVLLPGGWSVIGTALVNVYDPHREQPFLLHLGDRVRFHAAPGEPPAPPTVRELLPPEPRLPALLVAEPGAFDLVVDGGRLNQAHRGMAQSGPLDAPAANLANALCDNPPGTTLLECALTGPQLVALRPLVVGAAGSGLELEVDGEPVGQATTAVATGTRLRLVATGRGVRGYLAVAGGVEAEAFLGSTSVDRRGLVGRPLRAGDVLGLAREATPSRRVEVRPRELPSPLTIRLRRGPQWTAEAGRALVSAPFTVATGDRMGVRLDGPAVPGGELLSESPPPGAVQVTSAGGPILLLADRQRSAGYDKPAVIHPADLPLAAQLRSGEVLRFELDGDHPVAWFRDLS
jgi:KipI family sensor histidine kinase inhibitor